MSHKFWCTGAFVKWNLKIYSFMENENLNWRETKWYRTGKRRRTWISILFLILFLRRWNLFYCKTVGNPEMLHYFHSWNSAWKIVEVLTLLFSLPSELRYSFVLSTTWWNRVNCPDWFLEFRGETPKMFHYSSVEIMDRRLWEAAQKAYVHHL